MFFIAPAASARVRAANTESRIDDSAGFRITGPGAPTVRGADGSSAPVPGLEEREKYARTLTTAASAPRVSSRARSDVGRASRRIAAGSGVQRPTRRWVVVSPAPESAARMATSVVRISRALA